MRPVVSIIGIGKVGGTLARLLYAAGYHIVSIYNRTAEKAQYIADLTSTTVAQSAHEAAQNADLVILAVPDDAITTVGQEISTIDWSNKAVVHVSGAHSTETLQSLLDKGAMVGSLHPAYPFAAEVQTLKAVTFAIEASSDQLETWLRDIVIALNGSVLWVPHGKKALYHAALVIASNYTVTLYAVAQSLLASFADDDAAINNVLMVLLSATVKNIEAQGIPNALTGPLARADIGTVQSHLNILEDDNIRQLYMMLAQHTLPLVEARGGDTTNLHTLLQDDT